MYFRNGIIADLFKDVIFFVLLGRDQKEGEWMVWVAVDSVFCWTHFGLLLFTFLQVKSVQNFNHLSD